jgi:hypothetical protein
LLVCDKYEKRSLYGTCEPSKETKISSFIKHGDKKNSLTLSKKKQLNILISSMRGKKIANTV